MRGAMLRLVEVEEVEFELWIDGEYYDTYQSREQAEADFLNVVSRYLDDGIPHEVREVTRVIEQEILDVEPGDYD